MPQTSEATGPTRAARRSLWDRPETPPAFRLKPRDLEILRAVYEHRYVETKHVLALFGEHGEVERQSADTNLARRLRRLWQHGYLERPKSARPTRASTGEFVYALGYAGARALERQPTWPRENPISGKDWGKQRGWGSIEHELRVSTTLVACRVAARKLRLTVEWTTYPERDSIKLETPDGKKIEPDGYFRFDVRDGDRREVRHHFLEIDRGSFLLDSMRRRYERYLAWWRANRDDGFQRLRVITIAETPEHAESLRGAAESVGRSAAHALPWQALLFSDFTRFDLVTPERLFTAIYRAPGNREPIALL